MAEPAGVDRAAEKLDEATTELRNAIGTSEGTVWSKRVDDLALLKEQIVDIRQQLELLKLEVAAESEPTVLSHGARGANDG